MKINLNTENIVTTVRSGNLGFIYSHLTPPRIHGTVPSIYTAVTCHIKL